MEPQTVLSITLLTSALLALLAAWRATWPRPMVLLGALLLVGTGLNAVLTGPTKEAPASGTAVVMLALAGLAAVVGGGPVTTAVFNLIEGESEAGNPGPVRRAGEILRGGAVIGVLERTAIYAALLAGWPEGLALVLAVKGLGRYPELRNQDSPGTAERFIIGTFSSVLWAVACAFVANAIR